MLSSRKVETSTINSNSSYSPPPVSHYDRSEDTGPSIVNKQLTIKGDLESEGDIHVKGKVIGNIKCKLLIVDVDACVEGGVIADEIVVRSKTKGTIHANRVKLEKTAMVESEIEYNVFSAEEGARIKGALRFKDEPIGKGQQDGLSLVA